MTDFVIRFFVFDKPLKITIRARSEDEARAILHKTIIDKTRIVSVDITQAVVAQEQFTKLFDSIFGK